MNRRSFILSGTAGIALLGTGAAAQRGSTSSSVIVSEVTGAEIDFTESGFTLEHQEINMVIGGDGAAYDHEHIHFVFEGGKLEVELLASGAYDWQEDMATVVETFKQENTVEEHVYADITGGGYAAVSFDTSAAYIEYQLGSFPDVDMRVFLLTEQEAFQDDLARAQTILVGGAAPFMFMEESKVADIVFAGAAQTTGTRNTRTTRSTSGSQSSSTTTSNSSETSRTESTGTRSNTSGSASASGSESDYVDMIVAHREEFLATYDVFMGHLEIAADETVTEAERSDVLAQMYDIALEWQAYPDAVMAVEVPSSLTELSTLYMQWALTIAELGTLFEEIYNGEDAIDAFLATFDDWELLDAELEAALQEYGFQGSTRTSLAIRRIRSGLRATWRSLHELHPH